VTARHVWHKTNGWQAGHWESINVFHADEKRHECKVLSFPNVGQDGEIGTRKAQGYHPTPKPIALMIHLFDELKAGENLLDLFLGSGSTLIACEKTNRKCYGLELDPHYCSVIIERWQKFTGKSAELLA
jgi:DNA modification methylase